jgi:hypothetical protein
MPVICWQTASLPSSTGLRTKSQILIYKNVLILHRF